MLILKSNTLNNFVDTFVLKLSFNVYLFIYKLHDTYSLYIYVYNTHFDSLNISFLWNKTNTTNWCIVKYFIIFWRRIVFKGKGFRVRIFRDNKKITLNFGYSHWTKLKFLSNWDVFRLYRQNYLSFCNSWRDFLSFELLLPTIKPMNRYTLRGLRFKKQVIKRRFGKISQYISSLH